MLQLRRSLPLQIVVRVADQGQPSRVATSILTLVVKSNFMTPFFANAPFSNTVMETFDINRPVLVTPATDNDLVRVYVFF
ncbi:hypothetical protein DPMN_025804 [Dreissena polymorpha]|uniref:Uncharacterized protein n=1 Tax=Dreissena polymorpha TaxID=45954 RepID=A0A9D4RC61_DREPO|nr:hypothetical protein DPMN_025804 [Dreissena polymorpha]